MSAVEIFKNNIEKIKYIKCFSVLREKDTVQQFYISIIPAGLLKIHCRVSKDGGLRTGLVCVKRVVCIFPQQSTKHSPSAMVGSNCGGRQV